MISTVFIVFIRQISVLIIILMFITALFASQAHVKVEETAPGAQTGMIISLRARYYYLILVSRFVVIFYSYFVILIFGLCCEFCSLRSCEDDLATCQVCIDF